LDNQVRIEADDSGGRQQLARYMIRAPFSLDKTEYKATQGVIVYRSKLHATLKRDFQIMPLTRYSMINVRAETVHQKPAYRDAFRHRRCLIPADGFYEWKPTGGKGKQPYFIHRQDGEPMAFAGLWERWRNPESGEVLNSCAIIVTDANDLMRPIHDRMPVILEPADFGCWLETSPEHAQDLLPLLRPASAEDLEAYPVSKAVNNPKNEGLELVERLELEKG
jgi:putative SOS response-associated peptidase YedK